MHFLTLPFLVWGIIATATAEHEQRGTNQKPITTHLTGKAPRHLEFINGTTKWVSEGEKWELKKNGEFFMDVTYTRDLPTLRSQLEKFGARKGEVKYPTSVSRKEKIFPLFGKFNKGNLQANLDILTSFHNRWYNSIHGQASYHFLLSTILTTITSTSADPHTIIITPFPHTWSLQPSIIVRIPGLSNHTIVLAAHQDSVNHADPMNGRAPGADDDGSGTVTILEVLRVLLLDPDVREGRARNTIEFHWYAAEEAGLLGSLDVWGRYREEGRCVEAMLQQDMTGFWNSTVEGEMEFGLMMDLANKPLMQYMKLIISEYTPLPWIETGCGGCGSDHMSAIKAGFPAVYIIEGDFRFTNTHLHGSDDLSEYLDYEHMVLHARMALGFLYELAWVEF